MDDPVGLSAFEQVLHCARSQEVGLDYRKGIGFQVMVVDRAKDRMPAGGFQCQIKTQQTTGSGDENAHVTYSST